MSEPARGRLRVYLGAAPGVGKTYAMLSEGHRRLSRGADVVVGYVESHGRAQTAQLVEGLEVVPRRTLTHRGVGFEEMDVDAVLARRPRIALVDELAHTNVPGSRNERRWHDVEELLAAGIDVISTVNVQHLASLGDVVLAITGVRQRETVPDDVVRRADQIELVDMSPQALRRRMAHGNVYPAEKVDAALSKYFRVGNLTALRELALLWVADRVDEGLETYRVQNRIESIWPARERIVVALTGGPEGETLLRRGARVAGRSQGRDLLAVHVVRGDGVVGATPEALARQRRLVEELGGTFHTVVGDQIPDGVLDFARSVNATQVVVGASRRSRLSSLISPGTSESIVRESGDIDVHVVTHERAGGAWWTSTHRRLARRRRLVAWAAAIVVPVVLTLLLHVFRGQVSLVTIMLAYLLGVVLAALSAGWHRPSSPRWSPGCLPTGSSRRRTAPSRSRSRRTHSPSWCSPSWLRLSRRSSTAAPHGPSGQPGGSRRSRSWPRSRAASCSRARTSRRCWSRRVRRSGCVRPRCSRRVMPVPGRRRGPWSPPPVSRS